MWYFVVFFYFRMGNSEQSNSMVILEDLQTTRVACFPSRFNAFMLLPYVLRSSLQYVNMTALLSSIYVYYIYIQCITYIM